MDNRALQDSERAALCHNSGQPEDPGSCSGWGPASQQGSRSSSSDTKVILCGGGDERTGHRARDFSCNAFREEKALEMIEN